MDEDERLRRLTQPHRSRAEARKPQALGGIISVYIGNCVQERHSDFIQVNKAWADVVPSEIAAFCKLAGVSRGTVRVTVNSPSHLHSLRMSSAILLGSLQQRVGRGLVKKIRFEIGC